MGGIDPPGKTGGEDAFLARLNTAFKILGHTIGIGITAFVVVIISADLILSPIFLFAQAEENGITIGAPFVSASWWIVILMTISTSGVLYALLNERVEKGSLGWKIGWTIALLDTFLDCAGFAAWVNGGELLRFKGNAEGLQLGLFPAAGSHWIIWLLYVVVFAVCLVHEPFLTIVLKRENFIPSPEDPDGKAIILQWVERAGKIDNNVKLFCLAFAPWAMMFMDGLLGPQAVGGTGVNRVAEVVWYVVTFMIMLGGMALWNSWSHISERGFKLKDLSPKYKGVFIGALTVSAIDSFFDLMGFNEALFGKSELLPTHVMQGGTIVIVPYLLTTAMVLIICTTFEPLNHDLFVNLLRKTGFAGGGGMPDDFGGGMPPDMGGMPPDMGGMPPMGGPGGMPPMGDDDPFAGGGKQF